MKVEDQLTPVPPAWTRLAGEKNVSDWERLASMAAAFGVAKSAVTGRKPKLIRFCLSVLAGEFARRSLTGHSYLYASLGAKPRTWDGAKGKVVSIISDQTFPVQPLERYITIQGRPEELFPRLLEVETLRRALGTEWLAEIQGVSEDRRLYFLRPIQGEPLEIMVTQEASPHLIEWECIRPGQFGHKGRIRIAAAGEHGSSLHVTFYASRMLQSRWSSVQQRWALGGTDAWLRSGLRRLKQWLETGELATTNGQPQVIKPMFEEPLALEPETEVSVPGSRKESAS